MKQITDNEFEIKYKLYNDDLMKIAYGYTHNIIDSEDIVHDVFLKYLCAHKAFKDLDHEKYWLIRVTINYSIDCLRKKKKIVYDDNLIMNLQDSNNKKKAILCHVDELDDNNKTIIIMFYYNSMTIEEISKALNISYSAAAKRISRARKKMVEIIEGENNG